MHGQGIFTWGDGKRYIGNYVNDKKEGKGEFHWPNGQVFQGFWKEGKQDGPGILIDIDGSKK